MDGSLGDDIFIVPNEIHLLPDITEEPIDLFLTQIVGSVEPVRAENSDLKVFGFTLLVGIQCVEEGSAIVPFQVVETLSQLVLYDVKVSTIRPIVPEIDDLVRSIDVHVEKRVELWGPWTWSWG